MNTIRRDYHEIIDVLSESINLTESIPIHNETEDFEPIFADDYSTQTNTYTPNEEIISTENEHDIHLQESNNSSIGNINFFRYKREHNGARSKGQTMQINNLAQNNSNVDRIALSSDSEDEYICSSTEDVQNLGTSNFLNQNNHNEVRVEQNFRILFDGSSSCELEPNHIECRCHRKRILRNTSFSQIQNNKNTLQNSLSINSLDPLPGPSGLSLSIQAQASQNNWSTENTESNRSGVSDVLTAPELQLDFFSDSSNDSTETETNNEATGSQPSGHLISSSRTNNRDGLFNNRSYGRQPNTRDFYSRSSHGSAGPMRSYNRQLVGRNDNLYRRRFYHNFSQSSTYIPHQRLWHQQYHFQEMYRRFMSNNYDERNSNNSTNSNSSNWRRYEQLDPYSYLRLNLRGTDDSTLYFPSTNTYLNRGASQEIIEKYTLCYKFSTINESFNNEKCSICLSNFKEVTFVRRLPCLHFYHCECIEYWLRLNSTCPVCRIDIQKK
ncbi:putative uncharacterized protein DDB_G0282133 isoform X2 [Culicoides brevitarsis]|uniref:putative uncharacterized protein DDB_G0282133 isoform X2 n=1 Tax=Culicoides brevitarsis TaxID=469753 RepID=UPI00307B5905